MLSSQRPAVKIDGASHSLERIRSAIAAIREACLAWTAPGHYATDTLHDAEHILAFGGAPFVWVLRECGTHYVRPGHVHELPMILRTFEDVLGVYVWTGSELRKAGGIGLAKATEAELILRGSAR